MTCPEPSQPTEWVRWPCPVAGCDVVAVGRTVDDARKALYIDHAKEAGHVVPDA